MKDAEDSEKKMEMVDIPTLSTFCIQMFKKIEMFNLP